MRLFVVALSMIAVVGCLDPATFETQRSPSTAPGIASSNDVADVQGAAGGALDKMNATPAANSLVAEGKTAVPTAGDTTNTEASTKPSTPTTPTTPTTPAAPATKPIPKVAAKLVNMPEALKNPNIVVSENKITGSDPLSAAASAYVSQRARVQMLSFKSSIKTHKAVNGKNPTYKEFMQLVQKHRIEFNTMPAYRMYGYDPQTGGIAILEDKAEKARLHKEAGIPLDE